MYGINVVGIFFTRFKLVLKSDPFSPHFEVVNFNSNTT